MGTTMFFMPESPYFLLSKGKEEQAINALQWLRGNNYDVQDELQQMKTILKEQEDIGTITPREFFTKSYYVKPFTIMLALMFLQQYSGINAVMFYLTDIFNAANTGLSSEVSATYVALVMVGNKNIHHNNTLYIFYYT